MLEQIEMIKVKVMQKKKNLEALRELHAQ